MKEHVFPFTLHCNDKGWSAYEFRSSFLASKPDDLSWYGYDVIIHSRTNVEFVVYSMRNSFSGGLGREIARFSAKVPASMTNAEIERRALHLATIKREAELHAVETEIILDYAAAILKQIDSA